MSIRPVTWILLGPVFALLFFNHGFGAGKAAPEARPPQMSSRVDYDPKLTDPFFKANEWSYWPGAQHIESGMVPEGEKPTRLKHTAKCFATSFGVEHWVRFCEAQLLLDADTIELFITESNPGFHDRLRVRVRNGMFTCEYWTLYRSAPVPGQKLTWTTTRQKLTLDKKVYRKGDVIKGRIDFECLDELINPKYPNRPPRTITLKGVFKTVVE
ncbi:MAG: hypothetical protein AB1646_14845 [Thermodesulfobacteriota bacterium]